eukprot:scaffold610_cov352-Pavlova_lutheri.AAC.21
MDFVLGTLPKVSHHHPSQRASFKPFLVLMGLVWAIYQLGGHDEFEKGPTVFLGEFRSMQQDVLPPITSIAIQQDSSTRRMPLYVHEKDVLFRSHAAPCMHENEIVAAEPPLILWDGSNERDSRSDAFVTKSLWTDVWVFATFRQCEEIHKSGFSRSACLASDGLQAASSPRHMHVSCSLSPRLHFTLTSLVIRFHGVLLATLRSPSPLRNWPCFPSLHVVGHSVGWQTLTLNRDPPDRTGSLHKTMWNRRSKRFSGCLGVLTMLLVLAFLLNVQFLDTLQAWWMDGKRNGEAMEERANPKPNVRQMSEQERSLWEIWNQVDVPVRWN